jgi:hypothetical protein
MQAQSDDTQALSYDRIVKQKFVKALHTKRFSQLTTNNA